MPETNDTPADTPADTPVDTLAATETSPAAETQDTTPNPSDDRQPGRVFRVIMYTIGILAIIGVGGYTISGIINIHNIRTAQQTAQNENRAVQEQLSKRFTELFGPAVYPSMFSPDPFLNPNEFANQEVPKTFLTNNADLPAVVAAPLERGYKLYVTTKVGETPQRPATPDQCVALLHFGNATGQLTNCVYTKNNKVAGAIYNAQDRYGIL